VIVEDPLWGWVFAMVATYGLRPHEVWPIDGLPDQNGLITIGVAARHIKVTKTGSWPRCPCLPSGWSATSSAERMARSGWRSYEPQDLSVIIPGSPFVRLVRPLSTPDDAASPLISGARAAMPSVMA